MDHYYVKVTSNGVKDDKRTGVYGPFTKNPIGRMIRNGWRIKGKGEFVEAVNNGEDNDYDSVLDICGEDHLALTLSLGGRPSYYTLTARITSHQETKGPKTFPWKI